VALHRDDLYEDIKSKSYIYLFREGERIDVCDGVEDEYSISTSTFRAHKVRTNTIRVVNSYLKEQRQDVIDTYDAIKMAEYYDFASRID